MSFFKGIPEGCIINGQFFAVGETFIPDPMRFPCEEHVCIKGNDGPIDQINRIITCPQIQCPLRQHPVIEMGKCCPERCEGKSTTQINYCLEI